jgi:hypothetical protein
MRFHLKVCVVVSALCGLAVHGGGGDSKPVQPMAKPSRDVLRRVRMSPHVEAIRNRLAGLMIVRDPVTGEWRGPESGDQAITQGLRQNRALPQPTVQHMPNGSRAARSNPYTIGLLTLTRDSRGQIHFRCTDAAHTHSAAVQEESYEK